MRTDQHCAACGGEVSSMGGLDSYPCPGVSLPAEVHGYTCGHCSWGRDTARTRGEYEAHKATTGHVGERQWCSLTAGCLLPPHERGKPPCVTEGPHGERREELREGLDLYHSFVLGLLIGQPKLQAAARAEWEARRKEIGHD
jgi:hypothetical protein